MSRPNRKADMMLMKSAPCTLFEMKFASLRCPPPLSPIAIGQIASRITGPAFA